MSGRRVRGMSLKKRLNMTKMYPVLEKCYLNGKLIVSA